MSLLSNGQETLQVLENVIPAETLPTWTEGDRKNMKWKKADRLPKSIGKKQVDKTIQLQTYATVREKEWFRGMSHKPRKQSQGP